MRLRHLDIDLEGRPALHLLDVWRHGLEQEAEGGGEAGVVAPRGDVVVGEEHRELLAGVHTVDGEDATEV